MQQSDTTKQAIGAANANFMQLFKAQDSAALARCYTEDGQFLAANMDPLIGRAAIAGFMDGAMAMGVRGVELVTLEVEADADTAIELGTYRMLLESGDVADHGKYIVIWKHKPDGWKLHRDMINSSVPAP